MRERPQEPATGGGPPRDPASFLAAGAALAAMDDLAQHTDQLRHDSDHRRA